MTSVMHAAEGATDSAATGRQAVIVGGGIAGLSAAFRLLRDDPTVQITLLEAAPRVGGVMQTEVRDGYVLEKGPDLFLGAKPGGWELATALGIAGRLHGPRPGVGGSFLLSRGRLFRLPDGLTGLVPTRMMPFVKTRLISPLGKLRVAMDLLIPARRGDGDESVESFVVRRLGREMYAKIVEPLLSGIFAGDGSKLSLAATFPHMRAAEVEHGSMTTSMFAAKRRERAAKRAAREAARTAPAGTPAPPAARGFLTLPGGQGEMIATLEARLLADPRVTIRTGACTREVLPLGDEGWRVALVNGECVTADVVILAVPAYAAADMIEATDAACAQAMREIPFVTTATVNLAYRHDQVPHALDGSGWTTPRAERRPVTACTWTSSKFEGRAPEGMVLLRAFVGDATNQTVVQKSDEEIVRVCRRELAEVLGVTAEPALVQVNRWNWVMPQYNLGHLERVQRIDECLARHPGLFVAGNSYRGIGIPDVIKSGEMAATAAAAMLSSSSS
ncbi:MAG TPA: protoporphyrinogen oxidase [Gemmatimonadaceae bacterium]